MVERYFRLDQTTRIHGCISLSDPSVAPSWHELSRPQVHGYDLLNVVFIDPLKFASIADEKVVRVFEAPRSFLDVLENLKVAQFSAAEVRLFFYIWMTIRNSNATIASKTCWC